jgi:hypothetical protein
MLRKSQYENRFKRWGFRKNGRATEWKCIRRKIGLRKEAGKESAVYLNGHLLSESTVRRETSRQGHMSALEQLTQGIPDFWAILT